MVSAASWSHDPATERIRAVSVSSCPITWRRTAASVGFIARSSKASQRLFSSLEMPLSGSPVMASVRSSSSARTSRRANSALVERTRASAKWSRSRAMVVTSTPVPSGPSGESKGMLAASSTRWRV